MESSVNEIKKINVEKIDDVKGNLSTEKNLQNKDKEKKKNRGCLITVIVVVVILLLLTFCGVVFFVLSFNSETSGKSRVIEKGSSDEIAVLELNGVITETDSGSLFSSSDYIYTDAVLEKLDEIKNNPNVKALVLDIESPGGEVVASDIIFRELMEIREDLPIVAYSGTMAASGGYYLASSANKFYVHPSAMTGSIGVIMETSNMEGLYEKLGIEVHTFTSGEFKDNSDLFDENSTGELENQFQSIVDESYDLFLSAIIEGRSMDKKELRKLADGRIYTGKQAVENGLADELGYVEDAIEGAKKLAKSNDASVVRYDTSDYYESLWDFSLFSDAEPLGSIKPKLFGIYYLPKL